MKKTAAAALALWMVFLFMACGSDTNEEAFTDSDFPTEELKIL